MGQVEKGVDGRASLPDSAGLKIIISRLCSSLSDGWPGQGAALSKEVPSPEVT